MVQIMIKKIATNWRVPLLLLLLGSLNILFGALQLDTIQQGPSAASTEFASTTYFESPIPIVLHIVAGIVFNLLGPLQFAPVSWQKWPRWHRWSGRLLLVAGLLVGLTGLWMNHFFPAYGGWLKYSGVALSSLGLIGSLGIALQAIRRRDISRHRAGMMRAIALALGPATQRLFILPIFFIYGSVNDLLIGLVVWGGFVVNLAVVEWTLWRERQNKSGGLPVGNTDVRSAGWQQPFDAKL